MPRESSGHRRRLLDCCLVASYLLAISCRVGYEEQSSTDAAGATTNSGAGSPNGGAGSPNTGGSASGAGEGPVGGSIPVPPGGMPATGGAALGGGASGDAGSGEAGGAGPTTPECATTPECSCAAHAGHAYWFCTGALEWEAAETHCETQAMQLVRIDSQQENDFLVSAGTQSDVFALNGFAQIGANDRAVAGEWRWVDGEQFWQGGASGAAVGDLFSNWLATSPSASGVQQCSGLLDTGKWQVRSCTAIVPFICESH